MRPWGLSVGGPVHPDEVWERYAVPALWPTWSPQIRGVDCSTARIAVGARGRVHGPLGSGVNFVVDAVDEAARTWSWTVSAGPVRLRLDHGVTARRHGGTTTTLAVHGPAPVALAYLPMAGIALARLVRRRARRRDM